jgi:DNA-binding GntR family transcriptional regulator
MKKNSFATALGPPVKKQHLQKAVYQRLRRSVLTGKLEPGMQIKIGELATNLNVSANPVREALRQLEAEGMVSFQPNKRIIVNKLSQEDLHDIYSILIPLEQIALEKCFNSLNSRDLVSLKASYQKMVRGDIGESDWIELNWLFHHKIHELTRSPRLVKMLGNLRSNIRPYFYLVVKDKSRTEQANREHELLLDAFKKKDRSGAKKVLRQHLRNGCKAIDKLLKQQSDSFSSGSLDIL